MGDMTLDEVHAKLVGMRLMTRSTRAGSDEALHYSTAVMVGATNPEGDAFLINPVGQGKEAEILEGLLAEAFADAPNVSVGVGVGPFHAAA